LLGRVDVSFGESDLPDHARLLGRRGRRAPPPAARTRIPGPDRAAT
jgi:hypothetical protein